MTHAENHKLMQNDHKVTDSRKHVKALMNLKPLEAENTKPQQ